MKFNRFLPLSAALFAVMPLAAQQESENKVSLNGSIQSDILFPEEDEDIKTGTFSEDVLTNTYVNLNLMSRYVSASARLEYLEYPLPGFEQDFAGWGVPNISVTGNYNGVALTLGDIYDQFGSGFIFRTYEERSLGIDNSLRGGRLVVSAIEGVRFKALAGRQRCYWDWNDALVWGGDLELGLDKWIGALADNSTFLTLGASYVGKHEDDQDVLVMVGNDYKRLNLPLNVGAADFRAALQKGNYNFLVEYAVKGQDPSSDNGYIYKKGDALLVSGSYSRRGMSALIQAKRSDNMSFRSRRDMQGTSSFINQLPAFTTQHTYSLATVYPYSTQPKGEWAFQGELGYTFKRKTVLGGKYGTMVKLNFSHIRELKKDYKADESALKGTDGYSTDFFDMSGNLYYQDLNLSVEKKFTKSFKLNGMYIYQRFNPVVLSHAEDMINSHIFILDGRYAFNDKWILRAEAQYLKASDYEGDEEDVMMRSNQGDWMFGLVELSINSRFMVTLSDMYNNGASDLHYYMGQLTGTFGSHRLMLGYGRTRAGYNCSGGVCRQVPASKGFQMSYNFTF